jgi:ERCC4-type nuclease
MIVGLEVDNHEPDYLVTLLRQTAPVEVLPLNSQGLADYRWQNHDDIVQVERKTWNDLLSDLSSVENQLMRQMESQPLDHRLCLLVEGIAVPSSDVMSGTAVLKQARGKGRLYHESRKSKVSLQSLYAWLYQVGKYMEVYQTSDYLATAKALVAFYSSDQKDKHSTFSRQLKEMVFHSNPQVTSLMGMVPGIGPIKAESLIGRFGTIWQILSAKPEDLTVVHGVGIKEATRWLRAIGRPDV